MRYQRLILVLLGGLVFSCQPELETESLPEPEATPTITSLPLQTQELNDLTGFKPTTSNWKVVGAVSADHTQKEHIVTEDGTGVLVNAPSDDANQFIQTAWDHGDLEVDLEVMMPKGSNSGLYFQGRYEIQLFDSWKKSDPQHSDMGGIYQRWDESQPEGQKGYEGHAPASNQSKAPGLWQHFHIIFRAPRFNEQGEKIENAKFESVALNGTIIHENVSLNGPTRGPIAQEEVALAPLLIQGDHGPVAFRNFKYKRYGKDQIQVKDLTYQLYVFDYPLRQLPGFDTLTPSKTGPIDSFDVVKATTQDDRFAVRFSGKFIIPRSGDYLFHTLSDDGSKLYLNNQLVVDNDFNHGFKQESGLISLEAGEVDFIVDYFNNTWGKRLVIQYEGPEIQHQSLLSESPNKGRKEPASYLLQPLKEPEMVRCFMNHGEEKKTHVIAIGQPEQVHYSINLDKGSLLHFWRGDFGDVGNMWVGRGISQLLIPQALAVEGIDVPLAAILENENSPYPDQVTSNFSLDRYEIDEAGYPTFYFKVGEALVSQQLTAGSNNEELERSIQVVAGSNENLYTLVGQGRFITLMENGYYNVGGQYYLKVLNPEAKALIREKDTGMELLFPISSSNPIKYSILW